MAYHVFGMCNPLYDIQAEISDGLLSDLGYQKGGMFLIDGEQQNALISHIHTHIVNAAPGGSGANTMIGVAMLGGQACYAGKLGNDEHGSLYQEGLSRQQVRVSTAAGQGTTGISVILVTPDAERTMCTFLGICRELEPADVDVAAIRQSQYLYVTGYLWDTDTQKAAVLHAMQTAREAGVKVALSLSDPFCVQRHKADFLRIIQEHVDLVFGNYEEAQALTETKTPQEAIRALAPCCDLAAVTMGAQGSLLRSRDRLIEIPPYTIEPVDTTGAGDLYAAGLLYGLTEGLPLEKTGRLASYVASQVVGKLGPRLDTLDRTAVARLLDA